MTSTLRIKEYRLATLSYDQESSILTYRITQDILVDVAEMNEMLKNVEEFIGSKKHFAVVDFGTNALSSNEARKIYADSKYIQTYRIADAFLVKSLAVRLVASFFVKVTKPKTPTKLFTDEQFAINWLKKISIEELV